MSPKVPFRPLVAFAVGSVAAVAGSVALGGVSASAPQQSQPPIDVTPRILPPPVVRSRPVINASVVVTEEVVRATVKNGVGETTVTYLLENRSGRAEAEADFLLPIPTGATVQNFALFDGETRLPAEMQNKEEATATYESIVRQRRDPALLTFEGRNLLRARVFPVVAGKPRKITLKLTTLLPREQSAVKYSWPLAGPHLPGAVMPERVSVHVQVVGENETLYSPTHVVQISDGGELQNSTSATWSSDAKNAGSRASLAENPEFALYVTSSVKQITDSAAPVSLSLLTFRAGQTKVASASDTSLPAPGGYFLVVATPNKEAARLAVPPRRVVLVLDRSGSMDGKKIEQARAALRFALGKLRPQDTFNVLTFSDKVESFAPEAVLGTKETIARAQTWVDAIDANGGTNINDALLAGLRQFPGKKTGNTLLFFTDGEPTVGTISRVEIVRNALKQGDNRARAFVFGVGYDVDVPFLDNLAQSLRGDADYVRPDENIEIKTSQFVEKTRNPVLENVSLRVEGANITDVYPRPGEMPDLFAGGQTVIVGRYTGAASDVRVTLAGETSGKKQTITLPARFPAKSDEAAFLPRLWASRKIGYLMATLTKDDLPVATRAETVEQIKTLSKEWGILTPYTGLFVGEPGTRTLALDAAVAVDGLAAPAGAARGGTTVLRSSQGGFGGGYGGAAAPLPTLSASAPRSGAGAVDASQAGRAQRGQNQVGNMYAYAAKSAPARREDESLARKLQTVGTRTFYLVGGVWQDAGYDAAKQKELIKVQAFSPAYFALTRRSADWAKWASVGETVTIAANATQAVQFGPTGKETLTDAELNALIPATK